MDEFHFIRPWWLLGLPVGAWLIWQITHGDIARGRWRSWVDEALQPFVLEGFESGLRERRWLLIGAFAAWALAMLALAGPTWSRLPVPAFRSEEALVVVMDLSRSMDAADLEPSRLSRAKLKLLNLLERRSAGQTALVVFSAHAFTVTPLTTDTRAISSLATSLSTDIMPSRGSYPEAGLTKAGQLLRQTGLLDGQILLVTDADVSPASLRVARELNQEGYAVSVLGVGTVEGGPISQPGGGFLTDGGGQVVIPRLDETSLRNLALIGGGNFARLSAGEQDLDLLFSNNRAAQGRALSGDNDEEQFETEIWQDQGLWLVLALLPFVALTFRRGWLALLWVWVALPLPQAQALGWADLWQRPDQRGYQAFQSEEPERAATLFKDPEWLAAALYRAGDYQTSANALKGIDTADGHYNRGNGLAKSGDIEGAIEAYNRALELDPAHEDAIFNRDLLQQSQPPEEQPATADDEQQQDSASGQSQQSQNTSDQSDQSEQARNGEDQSGQMDSQSEESEQADAQSDVTEQGDAQGQPALSPDDLEEWASEQAAEQWLRRIPQDPGGLLRRKFLYQYQRLGIDQDGNYVWPGDEAQPW